MQRNRGHILELRVYLGWQRNTEAVQHALETLHRKRRLPCLIASAVEPHDQSVANQLIVAYAGNLRQIFYAFGADIWAESNEQGTEQEE